jgi:hypothetical protein
MAEAEAEVVLQLVVRAVLAVAVQGLIHLVVLEFRVRLIQAAVAAVAVAVVPVKALVVLVDRV